MREVAQVAGVSVTTVGNVLNRPGLVAASTRQRVEAAMITVGFVRSGPARQLRGMPSRIVGVVTLDQGNPFYAEVSRGLEDRLAEAGCMVLTCSTDTRIDKEAGALAVLEEQAVRGIIITPTDPALTMLRGISRRGTPVVLLDHSPGAADLCAVTVDHELGGRLAAEHLIALGHRRLAFLQTTFHINPVAQRRDGICAALLDAGLDPAVALIDVRIEPPVVIPAAAAAVAHVLAQPDPPTAIMCVNDLSAMGVLQGLEQQGVRVPAEMSVMGYDDLQFASRLAPPLTTLQQPKHPLGRAAADLLMDEGTAGHRHRQVRFEPTLVVRGSTARPRRRS